VDTEFNVVTVQARGAAPPQPRLATTNSSCGICGSAAIDVLSSRLTPLVSPATASAAAVVVATSAVRAGQELFRRTGSVHAAAAFAVDDGEVVHVREDIGRHNAADKVIGRLLLDGGLPASGLGLYLSGRVSLEMVHKAWAGGFPLVVAVGGPSSLAVALAERANITLVAFARDERLNVYTGSLA
jgi:FdhD protein